MRKVIILFSMLFVAVSFPSLVRADVSVLSFSASPSYIPNAFSSAFTWQTAGGFGANIYLNCPTGVSVKNDQGNLVSCNTAVAVGGAATNDSVTFTFFNVSGTSKTMLVRLVPKDISGAEQTSSAANLTVTVGTAAQPITDFSASTLSPKSSETVKISWTGIYIGGVNLQFDCVNSLRFHTTDSNPTEIRCGSPAFSSDLPASGSYEFKITNTTFSQIPFRVSVLPSQGGGLYDATKSMSLVLTVEGQSSPVSPTTSSFLSSKSSVYSDESLDLYWNTAHTKGVNIQFECNQSTLTVFSVVGTTTNRLLCNTPAFPTALSSVGTTTISILNKDFSSLYANLNVLILLQQNDGMYTTINSRSISLRAFPGNKPNLNQPSISPVSTSTPPVLSPSLSKNMFTLALGRGSRGAQVTALQEFLAKDKNIYPEGTVSGYFGVATEAAVKRLQVRYGIARQGDAGYGYIGPKTRTKLNSLSAP